MVADVHILQPSQILNTALCQGNSYDFLVIHWKHEQETGNFIF